ncbi:MAG: phosphoglycerate dehydrogenase [Clostridiaceae bacterium]|jgi:D-3-phosphoglycerate dehydrogenase|nr:phosphoglycerate dehydrogenase [Clostridiaceae bacterium]
MYKVKVMNSVSDKGLSLFTKEYHVFNDIDDEDALLLRSADIHDYVLNDNLKAIARAGAGVNNIPVEKCSKKGIVVFNTPGANANAVKELVFAGLLLSSRGIYDGLSWIQSQRDNCNIAKDAEAQKQYYVGNELINKNLGVIGLGAIGVSVANLALHFGMNVYGYDPFISVENAWKLSKNVKHSYSLDEVFKNSDYITLHLPLNDETKDIINEVSVKKMKQGVRLLNFARDALVNEKALLYGIESGKIANYVTDFPVQSLIGNKAILILPHIGASTKESEENCAVMAVNELMEFLSFGNISNSVNMPDCHLDVSGEMRICCIHENIPKMISSISNAVSSANVNIENLLNKSRNDYAYTIIDTDKKCDDLIIENIKAIPGIIKVSIYVFDEKK